MAAYITARPSRFRFVCRIVNGDRVGVEILEDSFQRNDSSKIRPEPLTIGTFAEWKRGEEEPQVLLPLVYYARGRGGRSPPGGSRGATPCKLLTV